jgi:deazaflavin-dependent oxidoreductase (nitroreductase family)
MSTDAEHAMAVGSRPEPAQGVPPAPLVRAVVRPLTKVLNPVIGKLAGRRHFRMAAQIHHVGRRSGKKYVTPAAARRAGDRIVIPLTFGNRSDWALNVRAAGGCSIRLNGIDYAATQPEFLAVGDAQPLIRSAFTALERASFRLLGIRQVLSLHAGPARR